jgi:S-adenosylmethionine:tRNA ribosyltransferase-isomerase
MDDMFDLSNYDYRVPQELIAQEPLLNRDRSRLLVLEKNTGKITHDYFYNLKTYLNAGDCLVLNDTKVVPARLFGKTRKTGAAVEILVLARNENRTWEVMMKNSRRVDEGSLVSFGEDIELKVVRKKGKTAEVEFNLNESTLKKALWKHGTVPLPPYIKNETSADIHRERYQTVYAEHEGARAAPTAGLHFTPKLLDEIRGKGIKTARVTLHVGMGTFEAVSETDIRKHKMHEEEYMVDSKNAAVINETTGRIIAAGTTSLRVLESAVRDGKIPEIHDKTGIYIYPGYEFKKVQGLITNFHLPKTTLLALVYAFAGADNVKRAYAAAIKEKYRFFSYGDAMLII